MEISWNLVWELIKNNKIFSISLALNIISLIIFAIIIL